jgi:hypothetical protein
MRCPCDINEVRNWIKPTAEAACGAYNRYGFTKRSAFVMQLKLENGVWVFGGDGEKALFLINAGDEKFTNLRRLSVLENPDPPSREQGSDAPGRTYSSVGQIRSSVEERDELSLNLGDGRGQAAAA